jgi:hypothetical protein
MDQGYNGIDGCVVCVCHRVCEIKLCNPRSGHPKWINLPLFGSDVPEGYHERVDNIRFLMTGTCGLESPLHLKLDIRQIGDESTPIRMKDVVVEYHNNVVTLMYWYNILMPLACKSKNMCKDLVIGYRLFHYEWEAAMGKDTDIIITFVYNVSRIRDQLNTIYNLSVLTQTLKVCRVYRLRLDMGLAYGMRPILLKFDGFSPAEREIRCCITDSPVTPPLEEFTTLIHLVNPKSNPEMSFWEDGPLFDDYARHFLANMLYLHIRIVQSVSTDRREYNEDECSIRMSIFGLICGGHLMRHMVDVNGLTLEEFRNRVR